MSRFTDAKQRTWIIEISIATISRIRSELDLDLLKVFDGNDNRANEIISDLVVMADCLYICCEEEATKQNIDSMEFGRGLHGEAVDAAVDAFLDALVNFFHGARRKAVEKMVSAALKVRKAVDEGIEQQVDMAIEKFEKTIDEKGVFGALSTEPQASSG